MFSRDTVNSASKLSVQYGIPLAAILAIAEVESAGVAGVNISFTDYKGYKQTGLFPVIRIEGHKFYEYLSKYADQSKLKKAVAQGLASPTRGAVKNPASQASRYGMLAQMMKIDVPAAIQSISIGMGQVMGFHWKALGFSSPQQFYDFHVDSPGGVYAQLETMCKYLVSFNVKGDILRKDWATVAKKYNGPAYKENSYDTKMARAFDRWTKYIQDNGADASKPVEPAKPGLLLLGSKGQRVKDLQTNLLKISIYQQGEAATSITADSWAVIQKEIKKVDGIFGPDTFDALKAYQKLRKLSVDGKYGTLSDNSVRADLSRIEASGKSAQVELDLQDHLNGVKKKRDEEDAEGLTPIVPAEPDPVEEPLPVEPEPAVPTPKPKPVIPQPEDPTPLEESKVDKEDAASTIEKVTSSKIFAKLIKLPGKIWAAFVALIALIISFFDWLLDKLHDLFVQLKLLILSLF